MEHHNQALTHALIHMAQEGSLEQFLSCPPGRCARIELELRRIYHVHLSRRHLVLQEREVEVIRRQRRGRWQAMRPTHTENGGIVLERATGAILQTTRLGRRKIHETSRRT